MPKTRSKQDTKVLNHFRTTEVSHISTKIIKACYKYLGANTLTKSKMSMEYKRLLFYRNR